MGLFVLTASLFTLCLLSVGQSDSQCTEWGKQNRIFREMLKLRMRLGGRRMDGRVCRLVAIRELVRNSEDDFPPSLHKALNKYITSLCVQVSGFSFQC